MLQTHILKSLFSLERLHLSQGVWSIDRISFPGDQSMVLIAESKGHSDNYVMGMLPTCYCVLPYVCYRMYVTVCLKEIVLITESKGHTDKYCHGYVLCLCCVCVVSVLCLCCVCVVLVCYCTHGMVAM
jgi:hypothetical protein